MKLLPPLFTISVAILLALPVQARLGETEDQLSARYGKGSTPWRATADYPVEVQMFYKGTTTITVMLLDGVSVGESYQQSSGVNEKEMKSLLSLNSQGHVWKEKLEKYTDIATAPGKPVSRVWKRNDGAFAFYKAPYIIVIKSKQLLDADKAKERADKKAPQTGLQGF